VLQERPPTLRRSFVALLTRASSCGMTTLPLWKRLPLHGSGLQQGSSAGCSPTTPPTPIRCVVSTLTRGVTVLLAPTRAARRWVAAGPPPAPAASTRGGSTLPTTPVRGALPQRARGGLSQECFVPRECVCCSNVTGCGSLSCSLIVILVGRELCIVKHGLHVIGPLDGLDEPLKCRSILSSQSHRGIRPPDHLR
jgi:hypothetical protein